MSEVMKCDICGALYDKEYGNIRILEQRSCKQPLNEYDLCPVCVDRFHQWIDSVKNNAEVESEESEFGENFVSWFDDVANNTREVYSARPLTKEEKEAMIVEWTELKLPFRIVFVDPKEEKGRREQNAILQKGEE